MRALVEPYGQNLRHLKSNATNGATSRPTLQFSTTLLAQPWAYGQRPWPKGGMEVLS